MGFELSDKCVLNAQAGLMRTDADDPLDGATEPLTIAPKTADKPVQRVHRSSPKNNVPMSVSAESWDRTDQDGETNSDGRRSVI